MEIHESAEDYLETILILEERIPHVRSIDIVNEMGYSKPSISIAMKKLRENGYINMDSSGYITLCPKGQEIAERIYSRHKLLSKVLLAVGVDKDKAAQEACRIEHVIDDDTYEKLNAYYETYMARECPASAEACEGLASVCPVLAGCPALTGCPNAASAADG